MNYLYNIRYIHDITEIESRLQKDKIEYKRTIDHLNNDNINLDAKYKGNNLSFSLDKNYGWTINLEESIFENPELYLDFVGKYMFDPTKVYSGFLSEFLIDFNSSRILVNDKFYITMVDKREEHYNNNDFDDILINLILFYPNYTQDQKIKLKNLTYEKEIDYFSATFRYSQLSHNSSLKYSNLFNIHEFTTIDEFNDYRYRYALMYSIFYPHIKISELDKFKLMNDSYFNGRIVKALLGLCWDKVHNPDEINQDILEVAIDVLFMRYDIKTALNENGDEPNKVEDLLNTNIWGNNEIKMNFKNYLERKSFDNDN